MIQLSLIEDAPSDLALTHYWRIRKLRADLFGQPCRRIIGRGGKYVQGRNGNVLIEFADGERLITPRHSIRLLRK